MKNLLTLFIFLRITSSFTACAKESTNSENKNTNLNKKRRYENW